jgi:hypothetical protein
MQPCLDKHSSDKVNILHIRTLARVFKGNHLLAMLVQLLQTVQGHCLQQLPVVYFIASTMVLEMASGRGPDRWTGSAADEPICLLELESAWRFARQAMAQHIKQQ